MSQPASEGSIPPSRDSVGPGPTIPFQFFDDTQLKAMERMERDLAAEFQ